MKQKTKLPNGWKEVELGDVAEFINGRAFKPSEWEDKGKIIIRIQDLTGNIENPNFTTKIFEDRYLVKKGDLLISWSATLDTFIWNKEEGWLNQHIFKVVEKKNLINKRYLFYLIKTKINEMKKNTHGSTMKHITKGNFNSITLFLPPLPIQKAIVSILEKAEVLKQKRQDADKLTKDYLQSVFNEMFENKGFEEIELGSVCEFNPKKAEIRGIDENWEVSFVPMADVQEHQIYFDLKETEKIRNIFSGYTYFKENDVLLAKVTPCFENGKSGVARNLKNGIGFGSSEFFVLRPSDKILSSLIYHLISSSKFIKAGKRQMSGTGGLKRLSKNYVTEYQIPLPPLPLQQKFASIVEQVEKLKEKQKQSKEEINLMFDSLMQKAFKGELVK